MYRESIPGYDFGRVPDAPISDRDFELLVKTVNLTEEDFRALRATCEALSRRGDIIDKVLDTWYGWVGSNPHLLYYFGDREGRPIQRYLEAVRLRFASGYSTRSAGTTIGSGSTTCTRSGLGITGLRRAGRTGLKPWSTSRLGT